ncbi:MAG TPA: ABC transporter substrate-binding protein [Opitutaceae bacterium]|jgi:phospholipid transport system substrate-binding protein|nr:ABC transporter substrate-binding protein [Opitutaceae bacterium]
MTLRIFFTLAAAALLIPAPARAADAGASATAQSLCDALLASMKKGSALDFKGREALLAPEVQKDLDLAFMARIVVGPPWRSLSADDQRQLTQAFSDYSVATYAQEFASYSKDRFEVDPTPAAMGGNTLVHTKFFPGGGDPVQLDYLMRQEASGWKIIDVYLNGSISQMAARRSEYSTTLRQGGASALIALLKKKTADLGG